MTFSNNNNGMATIRETLLSKKASSELIETVIKVRFNAEAMHNRFPDELSEDNPFDIASFMLNMFAQGNLDIIHEYSEFPIEKIFLGAVNVGMVFLCVETFALPFINFLSPSKSAPDITQANRKYWKKLNETRRLFSRISETNDPVDFIDFAIKHGAISSEHRLEAIAETVMYQDMNVGNTYQLMPQARFPQIKNAGRSIRADILIWKPTDDDFNLIVECDGYQYHNTAERFSNDRSRDRLLKTHGYDVFRFSGTEIYHRPVEMAKELTDYLFKHADPPEFISQDD